MLVSEEIYSKIRDLLYKSSRINLGPDKKQLVTTRLNKRIQYLGLNSFEDYWNHVSNLDKSGSSDELGFLVDSLTTNYTKFFREPRSLDYFRDCIVPTLAKEKNREKISVWSSACSSGEEPYTLAIILAEILERTPALKWEIIGTDISRRVLETASAGIYTTNEIGISDTALVKKYFLKGKDKSLGKCRVKKCLRDNIKFMHLNLFGNTYPFDEKFDVIFCRNVMIYFDRQTQKQLVERLVTWLKPNGYLVIGASESITGMSEKITSIQPTIYKYSR